MNRDSADEAMLEELMKIGFIRKGGSCFIKKGNGPGHLCVDTSDLTCVYVSVSLLANEAYIDGDWNYDYLVNDLSLVSVCDYSMNTIDLIRTAYEMFEKDESQAIAFINSIA